MFLKFSLKIVITNRQFQLKLYSLQKEICKFNVLSLETFLCKTFVVKGKSVNIRKSVLLHFCIFINIWNKR